MDAFIGTILPTGFNFNPYGWQLCWGQQVAVNQYQALFALLATNYGGNGSSNFNLPDLRGRVPIGFGAKDGGSLVYNIGQKYGSDSHTVSLSEMPAHSHGATFTPTKSTVTAQTTAVAGTQTVSATLEASTGPSSSTPPAQDAYLATPSLTSLKLYSTTLTGAVTLKGVSATLNGTPAVPALNVSIPDVVTGGAVAVGVAGAGTPIDIRPSSQAINFIICINGIYPTRE